MSMLQCFFDQSGDDAKELFTGLKIMLEGETYLKHMSAYPVINISLKSLKQEDFSLSFEQLKRVIKTEYERHWQAVKESGCLMASEMERYDKIRNLNGEKADYYIALKFLSECLHRCHGKKPSY